MLKKYPFCIVNVFAPNHFDGNPLAVFPEADGLSQGQMQLIARQFNLSETVFIQTAKTDPALKRLKIFTPDYEMRFAGHPTLGAAAVAQSYFDLPQNYQLETQAGLVEIVHEVEAWVKFALRNEVKLNPSLISSVQMAQMLGLLPDNIVSDVVKVNTGTEQTLVQLDSDQAVLQCQIDNAQFLSHFDKESLYVWHENAGKVVSRLFFPQQGAVLEDSGTGSAAANLGGWAIKHQLTPLDWQIHQGDAINRPNRLSLKVDQDNTIWVGGRVIPVGEGHFFVPETQ